MLSTGTASVCAPENGHTLLATDPFSGATGSDVRANSGHRFVVAFKIDSCSFFETSKTR
jgi:hypothetical protein